MRESDARRGQHQRPGGRCSIRRDAVHSVADNWPALFGQVNANLVFSAGFESDAEERSSADGVECFIARNRDHSFADLVRTVDAAVGPLSQPGFDASLLRSRSTRNDRVIYTLH